MLNQKVFEQNFANKFYTFFCFLLLKTKEL